MGDVITISSESDKDDESEEEIIGAVRRFKDEPMGIDVDSLNINIPSTFTDLTDARRVVPEPNKTIKRNSTVSTLIDFTESDLTNGSEQDNSPTNDCQIREESINGFLTSITRNSSPQKIYGKNVAVVAPVQDIGVKKRKQKHLDSETQLQKLTKDGLSFHRTPVVKLKLQPSVEIYVRELKKRYSAGLSKEVKQMSLSLDRLENQAPLECTGASRMTTESKGLNYGSTVESPALKGLLTAEEQENSSNSLDTWLHDKVPQNLQIPSSGLDNRSRGAASKEHSTEHKHTSATLIPSPTLCALAHNKAQCLPQIEVHSTNTSPSSMTEQLKWDETELRLSLLSGHSSIHEHNPPLSDDLSSLSHTSPISQNETGSHTTSEYCVKFNDLKPDGASNHGHVSETETEDVERGDMRMESPVSIDWEESIVEEDFYLDSKFEWDFRGATGEDRHYVCPDAVKRIRIGQPQFQINEEEGTPEVLCRRSLSLVYCTIDEKYPEGTLQILSDLLQPGYYPPKDITSHLLHDILLNTKCPHHLCVQAFNLLMRTQRHHFADKSLIPWDWELLTSVMASQDHTKTYRWEVVRMLLEYVLQTLEDDFKAKRASCVLYQSIAKSLISCDQRFPQVRDVIKWLFSSIVKSTEKSKTANGERDEQIKIMCLFQRMLALALEVDCSPTINSVKLSQELFYMLISDVPLRAHRMLLLETLQSKLLRCKLLEHLLHYACPVKTPLPMSHSLLLHFLKNCVLTPDPTDGDERWQRWEELVHLLCMLLLSYNNVMKDYLSSSTGQRNRGGTRVYRPDDNVSKSAVYGAVETFLSRSKDDIGKALPPHVQESLIFLQDHLLNVCQC